MPEVMLRPGWPAPRFQRTIVVTKGKKKEEVSRRIVEFVAGIPVEVSDAELESLRQQGDLGNAVFEVERDEKNRPRFVESESAPLGEVKEPDVPNAQ